VQFCLKLRSNCKRGTWGVRSRIFCEIPNAAGDNERQLDISTRLSPAQAALISRPNAFLGLRTRRSARPASTSFSRLYPQPRDIFAAQPRRSHRIVGRLKSAVDAVGARVNGSLKISQAKRSECLWRFPRGWRGTILVIRISNSAPQTQGPFLNVAHLYERVRPLRFISRSARGQQTKTWPTCPGFGGTEQIGH